MSKGSSAKFYQDNKERLQKKKVCKRYRILSREEKEKKRQYGCDKYKNLPEEEKGKLVEYRTKYHKKNYFIIIIINYFHLENFIFFLRLD